MTRRGGTPDPERLQKVAARAGLSSRRGFEALVREGRVSVNGAPAGLGDGVRAGDRVTVDGRQFGVVAVGSEKTRVLLYHKPEGEVTTRSDPEGRPTVFDRLPRLRNGRWVAVGRLDLNTSGLLLLTTDGELASAMMHPSGNVDREYACRIRGEVSDEVLEKLRAGVELEDGPARFSDIVPGEGSGTNRWYFAVIMEGRKREVRRLWESQGVIVNRLKRVRYGAVFLPEDLRPGRWVELQPSDIRTLREDVGLAPGAEALTLRPVKPSADRPKRGRTSIRKTSRRDAKTQGKKTGRKEAREGGKPRRKDSSRRGAKARRRKL